MSLKGRDYLLNLNLIVEVGFIYMNVSNIFRRGCLGFFAELVTIRERPKLNEVNGLTFAHAQLGSLSFDYPLSLASPFSILCWSLVLSCASK